MISFEEFQKMDIRIGKIKEAEKVEGTDKLVKMQIDIGTETRQLVAGIADHFDPASLVGKQIPILVNLEPKIFRGIESKGMILVVDADGELALITPEKEVPPGSRIR